ncbi:MAG: hypothetical protein B1H02_06500, partial [Candidatus Latescibacteria bacterium 4484_107]
NITPEEARRQALENARAEAIRYAAGVQVGSITYDRQVSLHNAAKDREEVQESFATICEQTSAGKIVEEKPPEWWLVRIPRYERTEAMAVYEIRP